MRKRTEPASEEALDPAGDLQAGESWGEQHWAEAN